MEKRARGRRGAPHILANTIEGTESLGPYHKFTFGLRAGDGKRQLNTRRVAHLVLTHGACIELLRHLTELM